MSSQEQINQQISFIYNAIKDDPHNKVLFIVPESAGDILLSTSLLKSLQENYPNYHIYFACKETYFPLLEDNPYIYRAIEYLPIMDYELYMQGTEDWDGLFDVSILVTVLTQRISNYIRNGKSKIAFNLRY